MTLTYSQELKCPLWAKAKASWQFFKGKQINWQTKQQQLQKEYGRSAVPLFSFSCQVVGLACKYPCLLAAAKFK